MDPIIVISDLQSSELITTARIRQVTPNSFQARLQSPNYLQAEIHQSEMSASYMVVEAGDWVLENGARLSAGRLASAKLSSQGWTRVRLRHFQNTPAVLTQIQTNAGSDWVVTRIRRQTTDSFQVTMQEEEALNRGEHMEEVIGWVAMSQGVVQEEGIQLQLQAPGS